MRSKSVVTRCWLTGALILFALVLSSFHLPAQTTTGGVFIPRTGQTTIYSPGDDGDLQAGFPWPSPQFTPHKDGTITDNLTGLVWLRNGNCFGRRDWHQSMSDANKLASGQCGLTDGSLPGDWRLPNINEVEFLLSAAAVIPFEGLNDLGFTGLVGDYYWSSTTYAANTNVAWAVSMTDGHIPADTKWNLHRGLAVRGASPPPVQTWKTGQTASYAARDDGVLQMGVPWPSPRFTDNGNGTVADNLTGLVWLKRTDCFAPASWPQSLSNANGLAHGQCGLADGSSAGDWRLPNKRETRSILDYSRFRPVLPSGHPFTGINPDGFYWSSTTLASNGTRAWALRMDGGLINHADKSTPTWHLNAYTWPVRSGIRGPVVVSASPSRGGDTGEVTATIYGAGFVHGASVKLRRSGNPDIAAGPVIFENKNVLLATFDLKGKARGAWDIVVTNPDNISASLPNGFVIEEGRAPQLWVSLVGRDLYRFGRPYTFHVFYGNGGNIDAHGVPLYVSGIPLDASVEFGFEFTPPPIPPPPPLPAIDHWRDLRDPTRIPTVVISEDETEKFIPLLIGTVPAGHTGSIQLTLTLPTPVTLAIQAHVFRPYFGSKMTPEAFACITAALGEVAAPFPLIDCFFGLVNAGISVVDFIFDPKPGNIGSMAWGVVSGMAQCLEETGIPPLMALEKVIDANKVINAASRADLIAKCGQKPLGDLLLSNAVVSRDPNAKSGPQGAGSAGYISGKNPIPFAVFFENMESATAPAQEVVITDQLDTAVLNLETFSLGPITFGKRTVVPPAGQSEYLTEVDLRPEKNLVVVISARLDKGTGLLTWSLISLDAVTRRLPDDPMAGFLPPNKNSPEGEGSVQFSVMPKPTAVTGTEIRNRASIVFDVNEPIMTNDWLNTIDKTKPESCVLPLPPTQSSTAFTVRWEWTDTGAGVESCTVYASANDGPFMPWLVNAPGTSATFTGQAGKAYSFYSVARDYAGNAEDPPAIPDASTMIEEAAGEILVQIDIKPGSLPNSINPGSRGRTPVAVLTTGSFDAVTVDRTTVRFGATGKESSPAHSALEDVDGDGDVDLILHFETEKTGIRCGDTSAALTGRTLSGRAIRGSDSIKTAGCK